MGFSFLLDKLLSVGTLLKSLDNYIRLPVMLYFQIMKQYCGFLFFNAIILQGNRK